MRSGKVVLGTFLGVAAGAVLGLLFAPGKGAAIRKKMARTITDGAEDVQDNLNKYIDATTQEYDTIKKGAIDLMDKAKKNAASVGGTIRAK
jgi:gas vesicle protein